MWYIALPQLLFAKVDKFIFRVSILLPCVLCKFVRRQMFPSCLPLSLLVFSVTVFFTGVVPDGGSGVSVGYDQSDARQIYAVEREEKLRELNHQSSGWKLSQSNAVQEGRLDEGTIHAVYSL